MTESTPSRATSVVLEDPKLERHWYVQQVYPERAKKVHSIIVTYNGEPYRIPPDHVGASPSVVKEIPREWWRVRLDDLIQYYTHGVKPILIELTPAVVADLRDKEEKE